MDILISCLIAVLVGFIVIVEAFSHWYYSVLDSTKDENTKENK